MIIDFHAHVFPPQLREKRSEYTVSEPVLASLYASPKARMATADDLIASMDRDEVDVSVMLNVNWQQAGLCKETNDYIMESASRYSNRLVGFCSVTVQQPELAVKEVERCAAAGIKGVGEMRWDAATLTSERITPVVEAIIEHGLILLCHSSEPVGHQYPGKGEITPGAFYPLITRFPGLKLVLAHWGGGLPFYVLMPEVKKALTNVYFDTAATPFLYSADIYRFASALVGPTKILFGSDFPLMAQKRPLQDIVESELAPPVQQAILSGNAMKLLGISKG